MAVAVFAWVVGATFLISLIAWIGVLALVLREQLLDRLLLLLVALAAGALIGGAPPPPPTGNR